MPQAYPYLPSKPRQPAAPPALSAALDAAQEILKAPAVLIRAGSACVFRAGEVLIRVAPANTPIEEVQLHATAAQLLAKVGVVTPELIDPGQVSQNGLVVSLWRWVDHSGQTPTPAVMGQLLSRMQTAPTTGLKAFDPLATTHRRMRTVVTVATPKEFSILTEALHQAEQIWAKPSNTTTESPVFVHGDYSTHNVLIRRDGTPVLIDFENTGYGDHLWDLVKLSQSSRRFSTTETSTFTETFAAYQASSAPVDLTRLAELCYIADVIAIIWTFAGRSIDPWFEAESRIRLEYLKDPTTAPPWTPR